MAATQAVRITAKQLREGDMVRLGQGIGIAHLEYAGGIAPSKVLVRPAEQETKWFGLVTRWKTWDELHTPIAELPIEGDVEVIAA